MSKMTDLLDEFMKDADDLTDSQYHHVKGAMEEHAKRDSIAFLNWKEHLRLIRDSRSGEWLINLAMSEYSLFVKTDEELYSKFKEKIQ